MVDTFSIKEEKFIDNHYHANIDVSFNKKKFMNILKTKHIFTTKAKKYFYSYFN